jgi:hypothetical protein
MSSSIDAITEDAADADTDDCSSDAGSVMNDEGVGEEA